MNDSIPQPDRIPERIDVEPTNLHMIDINVYSCMFKDLQAVLERYNMPPYMNIAALEYLKACVIKTQQDGQENHGK